MTEAPHGTAPALEGKNIANPMAMILAVAALLRYLGEAGRREAATASRAVYEAVLEAAAAGIRTPDLGGHATTSELTDEVIARVRTKLEIWKSAERGAGGLTEAAVRVRRRRRWSSRRPGTAPRPRRRWCSRTG